MIQFSILILLNLFIHSYQYIPKDQPSSSDEIERIINSTMEEDEVFSSNETIYDNRRTITESPRIRFRKLITTTPNPCKKYTEVEKYHRLQSIGAVNQQYMASSIINAGRQFSHSIPKKDEKTSLKSGRTRILGGPTNIWEDKENLSDGIDNIEDCDDTCRSIIRTLTEGQLSIQRDSPSKERILPNEEKKYDIIEKKRNCGLDSAQFIPYQNCSKQGEEEDGQISLCSLCRGFYVLPSDICFPSIMNSLHCGDEYGGKCIFDHFNTAHGQCSEETIVMKLLENKGTEECEDWKIVQIDISVACQCSLNSHSNFLSAVPFVN